MSTGLMALILLVIKGNSLAGALGCATSKTAESNTTIEFIVTTLWIQILLLF